jgi:hypothetical protein
LTFASEFRLARLLPSYGDYEHREEDHGMKTPHPSKKEVTMR